MLLEKLEVIFIGSGVRGGGGRKVLVGRWRWVLFLEIVENYYKVFNYVLLVFLCVVENYYLGVGVVFGEVF